MKSMIKLISLDFDGTVVTNDYPLIGSDVGSEKILKRLTDQGNKLILYTNRTGKELDEAVRWFKERSIPLFGVNENPAQKVWSKSPKLYSDLDIDDKNLGCPLIYGKHEKPYVNWILAEKLLTQLGFLKS